MMNMYVPINCLNIGEKYSQAFLIHSVADRVSKQKGTIYKVLTLQDVTGKIEAALFDFPTDINILAPGQWVFLTIVVESYNNKKHCVISSINGVNTPPENITDYIPGPNDNVLNVYGDYIKDSIALVQDPFYRDVLYNANEHVHLIDVLKSSAYNTRGSFAYRGGLLIHTYMLLQSSISIIGHITDNISKRLDKSLIIAGCIFRNFGYSSILNMESGRYTEKDSAKLLGLRGVSFMLINHILISTESDMKINIPEPKKLALQNIAIANNIEECQSLESRIILQTNILIDEVYRNINNTYEHINQ